MDYLYCLYSYIGPKLYLVLATLQKVIPFIVISRINRINWLLVRILTRYGLFILFIFLYFILLLGVIIYTMVPGSISFTNLYIISSINKTIFIFTFMSLGRVPPFIGFIAKIMVIKISIMWINGLIILIILFSSFMVLFIYIRYTHIGLTYHPYYSSQVSAKRPISLKQIYFLTLWSI